VEAWRAAVNHRACDRRQRAIRPVSAPRDALPHIECGGVDGGTVLLSMTAPDGILFEYLDESMSNGWTLSIAQYVEAWNNGATYGLPPTPL
jgi:hypothetical protein